MKIMKWLRSCGVRNVNVFIDGYFYSELMQEATGYEMKLSTGYSLYPVFEKEIFHPKIWLLFGGKEGLLIVGSGNLTNSGNGGNDEIWGAYHFDVTQPQYAPVFSAAWDYISQITNAAKGIINEKTTHWITEYSQWLMELPKVREFQFVNLSNNENIAFLYNTKYSTIWQQINQLIGNEKIIEITAVSPYYDKHGKALEVIRSTFPNAQINVILDDRGLIPSLLPNDNKYTFYDWKKMDVCKDIGEKQLSRLHAKILYFKTQKNIEYCLFGSANITPAGLGISSNPNAEASIFIKSNEEELLNRIGVKLKASGQKKLSQFDINNGTSAEKKIVTNNSFIIKLLSAEINFSTLTLYTSMGFDTPIHVAMYGGDNKLLKKETLNSLHVQQDIKLDIEENKLRYIQIQKADNTFLSNKIMVSNYLSTTKTHPNPKDAELEKLCGQLQNGELQNVLDLLPYAIIDESEKEEGASILNSSKNKINEGEIKKDVNQTKLVDL
jgi:hypothetical protein